MIITFSFPLSYQPQTLIVKQFDIPDSRIKPGCPNQIEYGSHDAHFMNLIEQALFPQHKSNRLYVDDVCRLVQSLSDHIQYDVMDYVHLIKRCNKPSRSIYKMCHDDQFCLFCLEAMVAFVCKKNESNYIKQAFIDHGSLSFIESYLLYLYKRHFTRIRLWLLHFYQQNPHQLYSIALPPFPENQKDQNVHNASPMTHPTSFPRPCFRQIQMDTTFSPMIINDENVFAIVSGESLMRKGGFFDLLIIGKKQSALYYIQQKSVKESYRSKCVSPFWPSSDTFVLNDDQRIIITESSLEQTMMKYPSYFRFCQTTSGLLQWTTDYGMDRAFGVRMPYDTSDDEIKRINELGFDVVVRKPPPPHPLTQFADQFIQYFSKCNPFSYKMFNDIDN